MHTTTLLARLRYAARNGYWKYWAGRTLLLLAALLCLAYLILHRHPDHFSPHPFTTSPAELE